jgi:DNA polymerase I
VLEVPEAEIGRAEKAVREEMVNALELRVPLVVDTGVGPSWAEAH